MTGMFRVSLAATLTGLEVPSAGMPIEIKPYAISDVTSDFAAATPFSNQLGGDAGVDLKLGVTQGLTADLTYNTDFAQVEVDERQVNLTRFSLFFPEKREFFLEGQGIFDFGGGQRPVPNRFFVTGEGFPVDAPISLLQPPHRARGRPDRTDHGGRPADRQGRGVQPRPAQRPDGRHPRRRRRPDELHRRPREARRAAAQQHRRHVHPALALHPRRRREPGVTGSTACSPSTRR